MQDRARVSQLVKHPIRGHAATSAGPRGQNDDHAPALQAPGFPDNLIERVDETAAALRPARKLVQRLPKQERVRTEIHNLEGADAHEIQRDVGGVLKPQCESRRGLPDRVVR